MKIAPVALGCLLTASLAAIAQTPDAESPGARAARGLASYQLFCQNCHGKSARGDGSVGRLLKVPPSDLTRIAARAGGEFPFAEVTRVVDGRREVAAHGSRDMPIWGVSFRVVEETDDEAIVQRKIEDLVYYLESIQKPAEAPPAAGEPPADLR